MQQDLKIRTRDADLDSREEGRVRKEARRLERVYDRIVDCEIHIQGPGSHHRQGGPHRVGVRIGVPGPDIVVSGKEAPSLEGAIRRAFDAAQRQLEDWVRIRRGRVKNHESSTPG